MASFTAGTKTAPKTVKTQAVETTALVPTQPEQSGGLGEYSAAEFAELDLASYRTRFPIETAGLSDVQIWNVVSMADDDMADFQWKNLFLSSPRHVSNVDGDALAEHAYTLAAKESKVMSDTFGRIAQAREDWQGGPLYTLLALRATYEPEELNEFAIPGSDTGNNPDKFKMSVTKGDKTTTKNTTFYAQFARGTGSGKALLDRLDQLDRAADKGANKDGIPEDISEMSPEKRTSERSWCEGRLNTMTQAYKKAMALHFKLVEVNEYSANITAEPIWMEGYSPDDVDNIWEAKIEKTNEPIAVWLHEEGKPITKWEPFSIGAFLRLNVKKATEKGGGFKHLIESGIVKKAPGGGANTEAGAKSEDLTIKTVDKSLGVLAEYHRYLLEIMGERDGAEYGKLVQQLTKKGNDEYVTAFVELKNAFIDIAKNNGLDAKYIKIKESGSPLVSDTKVAAKV